ncbi:ADP-heptose--LPS heptosyltransferase [Burkholderia sp. FERM BP-3421]|jgi:hypothetical protein|nr:ADP-heptose--LPS heptosyltransferase [Burkholderia sp. FERM BP-3421]WDD95330.1 ADP-heptose--LPS heptosyltransferase [Burkholderia sp. FERM BP-3421]
MVMYLSAEDALTNRGSLVGAAGEVVAPYDLEQPPHVSPAYRPLAEAAILNAARRPFRIDYREVSRLRVVNGMGVALGDSIIGLTALDALRMLHPPLRIEICRPARAPAYVEALYRLDGGPLAEVRALPQPLAALGGPGVSVDLGNHLFWPDFATLPMIDFFLQALGVEPAAVDPALKANRWLKRLALPALPPAWRQRRYVLFCATASTPLRSIPARLRTHWVDTLAARFGCEVLGFGPLAHPRYVDIAPLSPDTAHFLAWVRGAHRLVASDSAAVHAAAGFDVPTLAFFSSIPPGLRVRDYPSCRAVDLAIPALRNLHASSRESDLALVEHAYQSIALHTLLDGDHETHSEGLCGARA